MYNDTLHALHAVKSGWTGPGGVLGDIARKFLY